MNKEERLSHNKMVSIISEYRDEVWVQIQKSGMCKDVEVLMLNSLFVYLPENSFKLHHKSMRRGYLSRRVKGIIHRYKGHFGIGFTIEIPVTEGTQYHEIYYFCFGEGGNENGEESV